jgi:hypothetical protein
VDVADFLDEVSHTSGMELLLEQNPGSGHGATVMEPHTQLIVLGHWSIC